MRDEISIDEYPLGARVKYHRRRRGLTQKQLASRCKLSQSSICQIEKSQISPSLSTVTKIARCLRVAVARLFSKENVAVLEIDILFERYPNKSQLPRSLRRQFRDIRVYLNSIGFTDED